MLLTLQSSSVVTWDQTSKNIFNGNFSSVTIIFFSFFLIWFEFLCGLLSKVNKQVLVFKVSTWYSESVVNLTWEKVHYFFFVLLFVLCFYLYILFLKWTCKIINLCCFDYLVPNCFVKLLLDTLKKYFTNHWFLRFTHIFVKHEKFFYFYF